MPRSDRLFRLLDAMRRLPAPVTAARLAEETEVSVRQLYRDIAALRAGGARIEGEAGFGYRLTEDPALPPQMFSQLEVEALVLGLGEVRQIGDPALAAAAEGALARIVATLPERVQRQAMHAAMQVRHFDPPPPPPDGIATIREACWQERALDIVYEDGEGRQTERRVWPLSIVFLDRSQMLLAWCCLRQDFRRFLLWRIHDVQETEDSFRPHRVPMLRDYIGRLASGTG